MAITLGVISDTHIPDRSRQLRQLALGRFQEAGVSAILHAGDVIVSRVLDQLGEVAPVFAVRGNRDWFTLRRLPPVLRLEFGGVSLVLTHGHGPLKHYLVDRLRYMRQGYCQERYLAYLRAAYPDEQVIVFGHTHYPLNLRMEGRLFFNPGSPQISDQEDLTPSIGLLHIDERGRLTGEIVHLPA